jgi:transmembrane sensor
MGQTVNRTTIEDTAAAWFARRESGDWSATEQAQLEAWLEASTAHRIAYIRIASTWERSGRLSALGAGVPPGAIPARESWNFPPSTNAPTFANSSGLSEISAASERKSASIGPDPTWARARWSRRLPVAAALLLIAITAGSVWFVSSKGASSYRTSIGALATIPLADGSKVTLNTDSQIDVALDKAGRYVELKRGEAFFDVSKDPKRPFVVETANTRVVAVGTRFSVRRDEDDMRVYVEEGRVQIKRLGIAAEGAEIQLPAGSEARTAKNSLLVDQPTPAQVEQLLSWRTGYLRFRDTALADAILEFNRYSLHKMVIEDPAIADIHIGGNFRTDDAQGFIDLLQSGFPVHVERRGELIILTKR